MEQNELCYLNIAEAAAGLRRKQFSAVELADACLDRIDAHDAKLHSFITLTPDLALEQARQAEKELRSGVDRGPLHGIPIALKDLYATKGIRTTCHSAVLENWIPDHDATTVAKLQEAGTVLLGKLGMHEFAFGGPSVDAPFPAVRNPWNRRIFPAVRAAVPARRWPPAFASARWAPTPADRSARRHHTVASLASSRPTAVAAVTASFRSAGPSIIPAQWRAASKTAPSCCKSWPAMTPKTMLRRMCRCRIFKRA